MTKDERNKARAEGKCIVRAQLTRCGWRVVKMTSNGGWTPLSCARYKDKTEPIWICKSLVIEYPDLYIDDNE